MRAITINKQYPEHLESLFKDQRQKIENFRQLSSTHIRLSKAERNSGIITLILFILSYSICFALFDGNDFTIVSMILNVTIWYDIIRQFRAFKGRSRALKSLGHEVNRQTEIIVLQLALLKLGVKK